MNSNDAASFPVVFTSLSTILLCFFIYLNTLTTGTAPNATAIATSVQQNFGVSNPTAQPSAVMDNAPQNPLAIKINALGFPIQGDFHSISILLPLDSTFLPGTAEVAALSLAKLTALNSLLLKNNQKLSLDIWQTSDTPDSFNIAVQQLGAVHRLLLDAGIQPSKIQARAHPTASKTTPPSVVVSTIIGAT